MHILYCKILIDFMYIDERLLLIKCQKFVLFRPDMVILSIEEKEQEKGLFIVSVFCVVNFNHKLSLITKVD